MQREEGELSDQTSVVSDTTQGTEDSPYHSRVLNLLQAPKNNDMFPSPVFGYVGQKPLVSQTLDCTRDSQTQSPEDDDLSCLSESLLANTSSLISRQMPAKTGQIQCHTPDPKGDNSPKQLKGDNFVTPQQQTDITENHSLSQDKEASQSLLKPISVSNTSQKHIEKGLQKNDGGLTRCQTELEKILSHLMKSSQGISDDEERQVLIKVAEAQNTMTEALNENNTDLHTGWRECVERAKMILGQICKSHKNHRGQLASKVKQKGQSKETKQEVRKELLSLSERQKLLLDRFQKQQEILKILKMLNLDQSLIQMANRVSQRSDSPEMLRSTQGSDITQAEASDSESRAQKRALTEISEYEALKQARWEELTGFSRKVIAGKKFNREGGKEKKTEIDESSETCESEKERDYCYSLNSKETIVDQQGINRKETPKSTLSETDLSQDMTQPYNPEIATGHVQSTFDFKTMQTLIVQKNAPSSNKTTDILGKGAAKTSITVPVQGSQFTWKSKITFPENFTDVAILSAKSANPCVAKVPKNNKGKQVQTKLPEVNSSKLTGFSQKVIAGKKINRDGGKERKTEIADCSENFPSRFEVVPSKTIEAGLSIKQTAAAMLGKGSGSMKDSGPMLLGGARNQVENRSPQESSRIDNSCILLATERKDACTGTTNTLIKKTDGTREEQVPSTCSDVGHAASNNTTFAKPVSQDSRVTQSDQLPLNAQSVVKADFVTLADMVDRGVLLPGKDVLTLRLQNTQYEGSLLEDGCIESGGFVYKTPGGWLSKLSGVKAKRAFAYKKVLYAGSPLTAYQAAAFPRKPTADSSKIQHVTTQSSVPMVFSPVSSSVVSSNHQTPVPSNIHQANRTISLTGRSKIHLIQDSELVLTDNFLPKNFWSTEFRQCCLSDNLWNCIQQW